MENEPRLADWLPRLVAMAAAESTGDAAHDIQHLGRVWSSAQILLAHESSADPLVVMAACFLHDLVNLPKDAPDRDQASRRSARLARHQLAWLGFPADKLDAVAHAIEAHSFSAAITPTSLEAQIVQDADRIDSLGAVAWPACFISPDACSATWPIQPTRWRCTGSATTCGTQLTISPRSWNNCRR